MKKSSLVIVIVCITLLNCCSNAQKKEAINDKVISSNGEYELVEESHIITDNYKTTEIDDLMPMDDTTEIGSFSLPPKQYTELKSETLCREELLMKTPSEMMIVGNTLLISDIQKDSLLFSISISNDYTITRQAPVGQGPQDFTYIRGLHFNGKELIIMDVTQSYYEVTDSHVIVDKSHFLKRDHAQGIRIVPFGQGYAIDDIEDNKMLTLVDSNSNKIRSFAEYPGETQGIQNQAFFKVRKPYRIKSNPQKNCLVIAGQMSDWLAFYSINQGHIEKQKEYFTFETELEIDMNVTPMHIGPDESTISTFSDLYATTGFCYVAYQGYKLKDREKADQPTYILQFDWNGSFKKAYYVKEGISHFAVDEKRNHIYATYTPKGEDPVLLKYEIE